MSEAIQKQIASIVECASVSYSAQYVAQTVRETWACDEWRVTLAYPGKPAQTFPFFTGLGLRAPATERDKKTARFEFGGLLDRDIKQRTIYGKRYLDWVESTRKPAAPHVADVLHSLILDMSACEQSFNGWCADMGMSDDSIKALETYRACQENADKLRGVFNPGTLSALRDALQDY